MAIPIVIAFDFGGALHWTQYAGGFAVVFAACLASVCHTSRSESGLLRNHILLLPTLSWLLFGLLQTLPLDANLVQKLSPGSHAAYTQWLKPILPANLLPSQFAISIAIHDSWHACAILALVVGLVFASATVFHARPRMVFLLRVVACGASLQACYGLLRVTLPDVNLFDLTLDEAQASFGSFINRNNAALFMNIGIAASIGLLSWRFSATASENQRHEGINVLWLIEDRDTLLAVVCAFVCSAGILLCGSRGATVAALFGALVAFGGIGQRRAAMAIPVVLITIGMAVAILLVPLKLDLESLKRFNFLDPQAKTLVNDGRMMHWPDGWRTAIEHLPAGSGLSTYSYAYLPYQEGGLVGAAHHADNLWLELFVEQGIIGLLLALLLFAILVRALLRLGRSPDPFDQGIRSAGWYFVAALFVSQFFDFGAIVPANLFLLSVLVAAIVSRAASIRQRSSTRADRHGSTEQISAGGGSRNAVFPSVLKTPTRIAIAVAGVMLPILAMPQLKRDAFVESLVMAGEFQLDSLSTDSEGLQRMSTLIQENLGKRTEPKLLNLLAKVEHQSARLAEVKSLRPRTTEESAAYLRKTNSLNRRLASGADTTFYKPAYGFYQESLVSAPLGLEPRAGLLYLDFVSPNTERSAATIEQLHRLHRNVVDTLILLGRFAASSNQFSNATKLWREAAAKDPNRMIAIIQLAAQYPDISTSDVVPNEPRAIRIAARHVLQTQTQDTTAFLAHAYDRLGCMDCRSLSEKGNCFSLKANVAYALGEYSDSFRHYEQAIDCLPKNYPFRNEFIRKLEEQEMFLEALNAAQEARSALPKHEDYFMKVIRQINIDIAKRKR